MVGSDGGRIRDSVDRLATLFREVRFSDKPTECSLCTFSANLTEASAEACRMIELCEQWSLLIQVSGGQRDRNVRRVDAKFQLNPMLAPRWDLPVYRRGAIALTTEEIRAVFDTAYSTTFKDVLARRISRMTAPFFGKKQNRTNDPRPTQDRLPGIDND